MPLSKSRKAGKNQRERKIWEPVQRVGEILTLVQLISKYLLFISAVVSIVGIQKYKVWSPPPVGLLSPEKSDQPDRMESDNKGLHKGLNLIK